MMLISMSLIVFLACLVYYVFIREPKSKLIGIIPPGPCLLNLLQIDRKYPFLTIDKWAKKYGRLYSIRMGKIKMYVVSDYTMLKEMFSHEPAFAGRMNPGKEVDLYSNGQMHGIVNTEGKVWEELRRFTLRHLRNFGFCKDTMETLIMDEVLETMAWMKTNEGRPISNIKHRLTLAVINSLWTVLTGQRFNHDDPVILQRAKDNEQALDDAAATGGIVFFFPWLETLGLVKGLKAFRRTLEKSRIMLTAVVEEHKSTYSKGYSRDFIDAFLKETKSCKVKDSIFYGEGGERQLVAVMKDLLDAGTETTSTTLSWIFLYLATFPDIQKNLQEELDTVIGNSRYCGLFDKPKLPYSQAFLAEVLRYSSIVPSGLPHNVLADVVYKGYIFPKDTAIMANVYGIHFNPEIWGDPKNFRPERFLSPDGKTFIKHEVLMPFSVGRRQCVGKTMANDTIFLFTTNIVQRFVVQFYSSDTKSNPGLEPKPGFILNPKPFKLVITERRVGKLL